MKLPEISRKSPNRALLFDNHWKYGLFLSEKESFIAKSAPILPKIVPSLKKEPPFRKSCVWACTTYNTRRHPGENRGTHIWNGGLHNYGNSHFIILSVKAVRECVKHPHVRLIWNSPQIPFLDSITNVGRHEYRDPYTCILLAHLSSFP